MPLITLTTDLGTTDPYLAMVKAKILTQSPDAQIIDITHSIQPYDIGETAFIIKSILNHFPKDTIHIVGVDTRSIGSIAHLGVRYRNQFILTANNGILSLIADEYHPDVIVELTMNIDTNQLNFPVRDLYAPAAAYLAKGGSLEVIGRKIDTLPKRTMFQPQVGNDYIKGQVIYVDHYGNAISNIHINLIKEVAKGRDFLIGFVTKGYELHEIKARYDEAPLNERLAIINSAGYLEIAINQGHAANLLGLQKYETIIMTFS
jgi:S-adenosylmethionine hydrolase